MRFLISVWGLLSLGTRKKCFTEYRRETQTRDRFETLNYHNQSLEGNSVCSCRSVFSFIPNKSESSFAVGNHTPVTPFVWFFSPMTVSIRAVFRCCTTAGATLTSVLPGDFNSRTFHQNSSNTGKESDQFRMEFMDIVHLSVPWSALSTVT